MPGRQASESSTDADAAISVETRLWYVDYFEEKYSAAQATLKTQLAGQTGDDALATQAWIIACELKQKGLRVVEGVLDFALTHKENVRVQVVVAGVLRSERHTKEAIAILSFAQQLAPKNTTIAKLLAACYSDDANLIGAIAELEKVGADEYPDVAIELADFLERDEKKQEAISVICRCYSRYPTDKSIRFKYARLAQELGQPAAAAYLLNDLCSDDPNRIEHWGYLGNVCLEMELNDVALASYRRAEALGAPGQTNQWITGNIGNILKNRGFPTEGAAYFERALKLEPDSQYAHERLAQALKNKAEEQRNFEKKCLEGKQWIMAEVDRIRAGRVGGSGN